MEHDHDAESPWLQAAGQANSAGAAASQTRRWYLDGVFALAQLSWQAEKENAGSTNAQPASSQDQPLGTNTAPRR